MYRDNKILVIIPARGGSKGIKRKNIKILNGKPLISYTIEEAKRSKYIDRIIVSTEDKEIADISTKFGAEVPFFRPMELAEDDTPGIDPIIHCVNWLKSNENYIPDLVICLQCTSPFRKVSQIDEAIEKIVEGKSDSLVSICEIEENPFWMKKIVNGRIENFLNNDDIIFRRQDLPKIYILNGAIYITATSLLKGKKSFYSENTIPFVMDKLSSLDIDNILDFKFAEFLMKENLNE